MGELAGRTAVVTAASSGLGHATAGALAAAGARVFIGGRDSERVTKAAADVGAVGSAVADFSDPASTEAFADAALAELERVDILVMNTGGPPPGAFLDLSSEDWDHTYRLVLDSAVRMTRRVLPGMVEGGFGRLIYFTSSGVVRPLPGMHLSNVLRSAVQALAQSLVTEVGPHGITTHVIAPAHIDTQRRRDLTAKRAQARGLPVAEVTAHELASVAVGRFGVGDDIASLVTFLSSTKADYLTGATHQLDGGFTYAIPI